MRKFLIALVLVSSMTNNAGAACTAVGTAPVILIPNFSDPGSVWAPCLKYDFQILQSSGVFAGAGGTMVIAGGISAATGTFSGTVDASSFTSHITGAAQFALNLSTGMTLPVLAPICWGAAVSANCQYAPAVSQSLSALPQWTKYTVTYANFSAAATTSSSTLVTVSAGTVVHGVKIKHSTAFKGSGITAYTVSVGTGPGTNSNSIYASAYDVFQAVNSSATQMSNTFSVEGGTATWSIGAFATSAGANLNAAAGAGSVDIWILSSVTPTVTATP